MGFVRHRAAVPGAAAFIGGALAGYYNPFLPNSFIAAGAVIFAGLAIFSFAVRSCSRDLKIFSILALLFMGGLVRGVVSGRDCIMAGEKLSREPVIEGLVDSDPEYGTSLDGRRRLYFDILTAQGERVRASVSGRGVHAVDYGDMIRARGYFTAGRSGRIFFSGRLDGRGVLSEGGGSVFKRRLFSLRRNASAMLEHGISDFPAEAAVSKALVLGYRRGIDERMREKFVVTGALHIFAISGLHVGIVCGFAVFLFKVFRLSPSKWFPVLGVILVSYTVMSGSSTSAVRACVMALIFFGAASFGRRPDFVSALAFTALLAAVYDPVQLMDAGFLLSFTVAGGIFLLGGAITDVINIFRKPDPFLPHELKAGRSGLVDWLAGLSAVSVSAWLVSAPLMLFFFGRLSLTGIISNILVVPFAFLIVLSGCCSLIGGQVSILVSDVFNHASLALVFMLDTAVEWFAGIRRGDVRDIEFGAMQVWLSYIFLGILTVILRRFAALHGAKL